MTTPELQSILTTILESQGWRKLGFAVFFMGVITFTLWRGWINMTIFESLAMADVLGMLGAQTATDMTKTITGGDKG